MSNVTEYKIGSTTYIVVTTFNGGESLSELIARLLKKEV